MSITASWFFGGLPFLPFRSFDSQAAHQSRPVAIPARSISHSQASLEVSPASPIASLGGPPTNRKPPYNIKPLISSQTPAAANTNRPKTASAGKRRANGSAHTHGGYTPPYEDVYAKTLAKRCRKSALPAPVEPVATSPFSPSDEDDAEIYIDAADDV